MPKTLKIASETDNDTINLALDTLRINKQALVFVNTKKGAEKAAEDISKKVKNDDQKLSDLSQQVLKALSKPTKQCERLSRCIKKGIAFHHAGLAAKQRDIVEDGFRDGIIKIICATPTLAMGIDLPAFRAIIRDLRRYTSRGMTFIPVLEYLQIAGRAGRPRYDTFGEAIAVAGNEPEKEKIVDMYINGEPENIYSKLSAEPVLRTYLLSLISTNFVSSKEEIMDFFKRTFWAHQFKDMHELESKIMKILGLLEEWEFIIKKGDEDFRQADEIDTFNVRATLAGKRVTQLYIDPLTASYLMNMLRKAVGRELSGFSLLQVISHTFEMRPLLNVRVKEYDKINEKLVSENDNILEREPSMYEPEYEEFLKSIKTAMMFCSWIDEKDEDFLMEEYHVTPGELRAKLDIADWLMYSSEELSKLMHIKPILKDIAKARLRLKYGVREELLTLLKLKNIGRVRARKLFRNKIKTIEDVKNAKVDVLVSILGGKTAVEVKKQVGQVVKKVPPRKRKGQISLNDF